MFELTNVKVLLEKIEEGAYSMQDVSDLNSAIDTARIAIGDEYKKAIRLLDEAEVIAADAESKTLYEFRDGESRYFLYGGFEGDVLYRVTFHDGIDLPYHVVKILMNGNVTETYTFDCSSTSDLGFILISDFISERQAQEILKTALFGE